MGKGLAVLAMFQIKIYKGVGNEKEIVGRIGTWGDDGSEWCG